MHRVQSTLRERSVLRGQRTHENFTGPDERGNYTVYLTCGLLRYRNNLCNISHFAK